MTHYETLGVSADVTPAVLKTAWRALALQHHPDRNNGNDTHFKVVTVAYEVLSDPAQRAEYDAELNYRACVLCGEPAHTDFFVCRSCGAGVLRQAAQSATQMREARQATPRRPASAQAPRRPVPPQKTAAERLEEEYAWTMDPSRYSERMNRDPAFYDMLNRPGTDDLLQAMLAEDAILDAEKELRGMSMRMRGGVVEIQAGDRTVRMDRQTLRAARRAHKNLGSAARIVGAVGRWLSDT